MARRNHALRNLRAKLARELVRGNVELRVVGSERTGFYLGGEFRGSFVSFGSCYVQQKDAVQAGHKSFRKIARKLLKKSAA